MKRKELLLANQSQTGIASLFLAGKLKVFAKKSGICFNPPSSDTGKNVPAGFPL
jgi:hypothetical protein